VPLIASGYSADIIPFRQVDSQKTQSEPNGDVQSMEEDSVLSDLFPEGQRSSNSATPFWKKFIGKKGNAHELENNGNQSADAPIELSVLPEVGPNQG